MLHLRRIFLSVSYLIGLVYAVGAPIHGNSQQHQQGLPPKEDHSQPRTEAHDPRCIANPEADVINLCHTDLRRRREIALHPKETLRVTVLDANPLIYSYKLTGQTFVEDQAARDAFRSLFALRAATPAESQPGVPARVSGQALSSCETRGGTTNDNFACFATGIENAAELLIRLIRETDLYSGTDQDAGRRYVASIQAQLDTVRSPIRPFLASDASLIAELDARYQALTSPTVVEQTRYKAARDAAVGVVRFWHEIEHLYLGPLTEVYNYNSGTDELVRIQIQNRLGDAYAPIRPVSSEGIALAVIKPAPHGFEFSTGLAFILGNRVNFSTTKLKGDTLQVLADTVRDLSIPPALFLSHLWNAGGTVTVGPTFGAGVKDLSQIENSTDLLGGITLGLEWFRLTLGEAYTSEISRIPGLDSQNRTTDPNILNRASRVRAWHFFFAVHGHF